jgi:hypothetical protein
MFDKVKEDIGIRKLNNVGRNLTDEIVKLPLAKDIIDSRKELEESFFKNKTGRVNLSYTRNVLIGLNYAETHFHYRSKISLLDDINNNKKVFLKSYVEKK